MTHPPNSSQGRTKTLVLVGLILASVFATVAAGFQTETDVGPDPGPQSGAIEIAALSQDTWVTAWLDGNNSVMFGKTTDGGANWSEKTLDTNTMTTPPGHTRDIDLAVENATIFGIAHNSENTNQLVVYVTTDAGATFTEREARAADGDEVELAISSSGTWALFYRDPNNDVRSIVSSDRFQTTDSDDQYSPDLPRQPIHADGVPNGGDSVYLFYAENAAQDKLKFSISNDGGATESSNSTIDRGAGARADFSDMFIHDATTIDVIWRNATTANIDFARSTDTGSSWSITRNVSSTVGGGTEGALICGTQQECMGSWVDDDEDPDVWKWIETEDSGATWTDGNFTQIPNSDEAAGNPKGVAGARINVSNTLFATHGVEIVEVETNATGIPEGVQTLDPDQTNSGFSDLSELRTSHSATAPTIWVRERNNGGSPQKVYRFDRELTETGQAQICGGSTDFTNDFLLSASSFGLAVTSENQPVFPCVKGLEDQTSLHLADNTGEWTAEDPVVVLQGKPTSLPLDARTATDVVSTSETSGGNPAVAQANLLTLDQDTESWDADDVAISYGEKTWVAYTGPTGTKVTNQVDGIPVAPAIGNSFDSVQIHDRNLWVASASNDEIRRYSISVGSSLTLEDTLSWETDSVHALRVTKDGRYLVVAAPTNYTLLNATTFERLGITNGTLTTGQFDVDANNNYLYAITGNARDTIQRFPIFASTTNADGDPGEPDQENPPPGSDPLEETATGDADPDAQADGLGQFAASTVAEEFGITEEAAGWVLAALSIAGMTVTLGIAGGGLVSVTAARAFAVGGATAGIAFSLAFSWIPLWFLAVAALVSAAVLIVRR